MNIEYFNEAKKIAEYYDERTYCLGAIGIRSDGVLVRSRNGNSFSTKTDKFIKNIHSHAEGRLIRKLNINSIIYIARITRENAFACAKPCSGCSNIIKANRISKVYYTIDNNRYGLWIPKTNQNIIFNFKSCFLTERHDFN